jgi:phosphatidylglycerophosphatase A
LADVISFQWSALLFLLGSTLVAWWACASVEKSTQEHDNGAVVVDEIVAFWWILWLLPNSFGWQLSAFIVFRWFDIVKPQPIGWLDQRVKGGLGVMVDDLMAAFYTLVVLAVWCQIVG